MSSTASVLVPISEEVLDTNVDSKQSTLAKGVKRRLQRKRAVALLKSAAACAEDRAARSLQDQRDITEHHLRQLESKLQHSKTESKLFLVAAKRYKQEKQAAQTTARELAEQLSRKEALISELQFQIQDTGGRQQQASVERVSAYLADPANVFAVPTARNGT
jgi:septal ring factor EnvC (AmiA/AmiB activator)